MNSSNEVPGTKLTLNSLHTIFGLAKPHCSVYSNPYHQAENCPNEDPSRKPCCQKLYFKNPPAVNEVLAISHAIAVTAVQETTPSLTALVPNHLEAATDQPTPVITARNMVVQRQLNYNPTVCTPLNVDKLLLELIHHPNSSFATNLISTLQ